MKPKNLLAVNVLLVILVFGGPILMIIAECLKISWLIFVGAALFCSAFLVGSLVGNTQSDVPIRDEETKNTIGQPVGPWGISDNRSPDQIEHDEIYRDIYRNQ